MWVGSSCSSVFPCDPGPQRAGVSSNLCLQTTLKKAEKMSEVIKKMG